MWVLKTDSYLPAIKFTLEIKLDQGECPLKIGHLGLESNLLDSRGWMGTRSIFSFLGQISLALSHLPYNCMPTNYNVSCRLLPSCAIVLPASPSVPSFLSPLQSYQQNSWCVKSSGYDLGSYLFSDSKYKLHCLFPPSLWTSSSSRFHLHFSCVPFSLVLQMKCKAACMLGKCFTLSCASSPWPFLLSGLCCHHWTIHLISLDAVPRSWPHVYALSSN